MTFDILLLIARPAAGKSEIIDFLNNTSLEKRKTHFHIGEIEIIDDFPMLWTWFEEDRILTELGYPRIHSDKNGHLRWTYLWDVLIRRICLEYKKKLRDDHNYHNRNSIIIEFSRGSQQGGYRHAFEQLSKAVVERAAILYINVSWKESLRKNRARFNPNRPDSILEHGLADDKLEFLYRYNDWEEISAGDPHFITIQGVKVPYAVFENEDDVTTGQGEKLAQRLEETLGRLWEIYASRK